MSARETILQRVRASLQVNHESATQRGQRQERVASYLAAHPDGPLPAIGDTPIEQLAHFKHCATQLASTIDEIPYASDIPAAIARYLSTHQIDGTLAVWPEFSTLDWSTTQLTPRYGAALPTDAIGITGCYCALAETGTLLLLTGENTPLTNALLPETHIAIVPIKRMVPTMEAAFAQLRAESAAPSIAQSSGLSSRLPRGVHFISGPSRTADIAQTLVMGAHGPYRVHIILVGTPAEGR